METPRPKIVVLDGAALNPGDLDWNGLRRLGECSVYDGTPIGEIVARAAGAEIVLTNKAPISRESFAALQALKYVGVTATGYNIIDVAAAKERGVVVANVPAYGTSSVAQMAFAHLLHLTQNVAVHASAVSDGQWSRSLDWCFWMTPQLELAGMTLGIVGLGEIGRAVARIAQAFGMNVVAARSRNNDVVDGVSRLDLDELFRVSDVVSLHCPLTPQTAQMVNRERLALMKPTAFLINTSRGQLIDEAALAEALAAGTIAGAGLDVLGSEPPAADNPLLTAPNCFITPHIAWATFSSRRRLLDAAVDNVAAFLQGAPTNVVS
jgi:glycerate dehydrogenase